MLPENAPAEYSDPKILWNSVENAEKSSNAQLARTFRVELPNEWSYELATEVMREYIKRIFTDKGMCVQFAIHDSENKEGQRNLHCHMLITLRGINEEGKNGYFISDITKELARELIKIADDKSFVEGVSTFAYYEEDRKELLDFIRKHPNISSFSVVY